MAESGGRQAQIISLARGLFLQRGYAATSMSQIAALAGGSKATLYHYFPSKQALFFAVVQAESARTLNHLFEGAALGGELRADLMKLAERFLHLMLSEDLVALYRLITAESGRFPEIGRVAYETGFARGLARMAVLIAAAMDRGVLKRGDPLHAAELLLSMAMGPLHLRRLWRVEGAVSDADIVVTAEGIATHFLACWAQEQ